MIASQYNGRLFDAAVAHGHPIEIIWDAQIYELGSWGVPRGTPRLEEVLEFIRFATGTRPLADQAKVHRLWPGAPVIDDSSCRATRRRGWTCGPTCRPARGTSRPQS